MLTRAQGHCNPRIVHWFGFLECGDMVKSSFNWVVVVQDRLEWKEPWKGSEEEKAF